MADNKLIEEIVSTYDIPYKLKDKITRIATKQINKFCIHSFDDVYEYISNLVEKFKIPFRERNAIKGDQTIDSDSRKTFFDLMGAEDYILSNLFEESEDLSRTKSLDEIICILESSLDKSDIEVMRRSFNCNLLFYIREEDIIAKADDIGERFRELVKIYEREGKLIIPRRPIAQIQFNPLFIKFKNRNYHGNPLAFFEKHKDIYGGMSRSELALFDSSLYYTLWKTNQLHIAIPECKNRSFGDPLVFFNKHKDIYGGMSRGDLSLSDESLYHALRNKNQLHIAIPQRRRTKYGKNALDFFNEHKDIYGGMGKTELFYFDRGLYEALKRNNQLHVIKDRKVLPKEEVEKIVEMYHTCGGNVSLICRKLNRNRETVTKYLKERSLKLSGKLSCRNPLYFFDLNKDLYNGLSRTELSRINPGLYNALVKTGQIDIAIPEIRKSGDKLSLPKEEVEDIIKMYYACGGNASLVSRKLNRSRSTIRKYLKMRSLKPSGR